MTDLTSRLVPVADLLCLGSVRMTRLIGNLAAECETRDDFRHFAMVAAFNAFTDLGGDPDQPETWPEQREMLPLARVWLARDLQASHTTFGDFCARWGNTARSGARARRAIDTKFYWDAWPAAPRIGETEQDRALEDAARASLLADLGEVLNEYELWVVYQHYWRGHTVREVAQLVAEGRSPLPTDGEPFVPRGRVEKRVQKILQRALERAGQRLGPEWRTLAEAA